MLQPCQQKQCCPCSKTAGLLQSFASHFLRNICELVLPKGIYLWLNTAVVCEAEVPESEDKSGLLDAYCKECQGLSLSFSFIFNIFTFFYIFLRYLIFKY
jgi:hypothetical protein